MQEISRASELLTQIVEGVNFSEVHKEETKVGDVAAIPGISSSSPHVRVKWNDEWFTLRDYQRCVTPLARIGRNTLNALKVAEAAKQEDEGLHRMIKFFLLGTADEFEYEESFSGFHPTESPVSHDFIYEDIRILLEADIIRQGNAKFSLKGFKVPKKEPDQSRFITDCRQINNSFTLFKDEKMNLPQLYELTEWGLKHKIIWSIDANAYFFQFKLKGTEIEMGRMICSRNSEL